MRKRLAQNSNEVTKVSAVFVDVVVAIVFEFKELCDIQLIPCFFALPQLIFLFLLRIGFLFVVDKKEMTESDWDLCCTLTRSSTLHYDYRRASEDVGKGQKQTDKEK